MARSIKLSAWRFWAGVVACVFLAPMASSAAERLVVHEWGTFTTLLDESGREVPGINVDDEPVPSFVHNLSPYILSKAVLTSSNWSYRQKGAPRHHPLVTMRLETPVIYFHLPEGTKEPIKLDVSVRFQGGWLTEYYPEAKVEAPGTGLEKGKFQFDKLSPTTVGQLTWNDLQVGTDSPGPETDWPVWNAPRAVRAASVTTPNGESEKYLFYRGVARQRSPLKVTLDREGKEIQLRGNFAEVFSTSQSAVVPKLWLAHIRADGKVAFRAFGPIRVDHDESKILASINYGFDKGEYSTDNLDHLKSSMHAELVTDGLFADEASALLNTWRRAYFTSHGLRLFFLVPQAWTDHYLPLSISQSADISRVMMGRVELISDEQRELLAKLAETPVSNPDWPNKLPDSPAKQQFLTGRGDFGDLGVPLPKDYQIYLDIGRFRNALIALAEGGHRHPNLNKFINTYGLQPYRWNLNPQSEADSDLDE